MFTLTKEQLIKILKTALYIAASAVIDYLLSITVDTKFGTLTPFINLALVSIKQLLTKNS